MNQQITTTIGLEKEYEVKEHVIKTNDKAATRQTIINRVNNNLKERFGTQFIERSGWKAKPPKKKLTEGWNYNAIVIHHQGNSNFGFCCGDPINETQKIQQSEMKGSQNFDDIGYHYIVSCEGNILEGRDIRFQGSHVNENNSNKIGILLLGDYSEIGELSWDKRGSIRDYLIDNLDLFYSLSVPEIQGYACITLIEALLSVFFIKQLGGHREFALPGDHRTCPGNVGMQFVTYLRQHFQLSAPEKGKRNE
ncbi:N-acetylmuramoyl-L-alanine amidase [Avibacterium volantium]|uniref:N-acetylmuramoyl-L-alanine amidase n=1 Tax=Avibacterium TaxID=292486 RepID=UPI0039FD6EFB